jgi:hypothetical protein
MNEKLNSIRSKLDLGERNRNKESNISTGEDNDELQRTFAMGVNESFGTA